MAKHFVAVCVVCLLCADHLPCKTHLEGLTLITSSQQQYGNGDGDYLRSGPDYSSVAAKDVLQTSNGPAADKYFNQMARPHTRRKRHSTHTQHATGIGETEIGGAKPMNNASRRCIEKIFNEFGSGDAKTMDLQGFEQMLEQLGLTNVLMRGQGGEDVMQRLEAKLNSSNISCLDDDEDHHHHHHDDHGTEKENDRALVWIYASVSVLGVSLCGMLGFAVIPCMDKSFYNTMLQFLVALAVGTLAGDALLHLLPHAMMLSMEAAGPNEAHTAMTLKGLVAVIAVIAFFAVERGLTMIAEWRKERQKKQQLPGKVRVMRDPESVSLNNSEKQCKNKYSSYPYCYDEIAMDTKDDHHHHHNNHNHQGHGHSHNHSHNHHDKKSSASLSTTSLKQNAVLPLSAKSEEPHLSFDHSQLNHHETTTLTTPTAAAVTPVGMMANYNGTHKSISKMERLNSTGSNNNNTADNNTVSTTLDDGSSIESSRMLKPVKPEESYTVILREHESKHHGHSHTHGHVHSPPGTLSAVAWMVVMGDGLHNFTDGMAIGAAFSNDIAGGFSTAIAVFCHELPHELGDFAVLLKAGMSAKKAVYYNFLSSILSFLGMVLGICIGDTPEASAWIFAVAAGLFIYIALVDMVPELTSSHHENCAGSNTLLQVLGMSMGLLIMLLIALNEHDLKSLFSDANGGHHHHHHH